jgi:hypothetical protein
MSAGCRYDGVLNSTTTNQVLDHGKPLITVSYPGAKYALNLAFNATAAFEIITDFLATNRL